MDNFVSVCWILMEVFSHFFFADSMLQRKRWTTKTYILIAVVVIWIFIFSNFYSGDIPVLFIATLTFFALFLYCHKGSIQRRIMSVLMCTLILSTIDTLVLYSWGILQNITIGEFYSRKFTYLAAGTISKAAGLLIAWLVRKLWGENTANHIQIRWLILALLFPIVSLAMLVFVYNFFRFDRDMPSSALGFTIAIALGNIGIMYLINQLENKEKENQRVALLKQQMEIQTHSILALEKSYRAQRTASHEFVHHMNTINTLLENQEYIIASQYVRQIQDQKPTRLFTIHSHHPVIDAVLNQKYQTAKENNIDMHVTVNDLSRLTIPTEALVVMLSNLLDNAIDAANICNNDKTIQCTLILNETFFLAIENSSLPIQVFDGKILTTKRNTVDHGYGIDNVKRILDGLHADYTFRYQNNTFYFIADIPTE